MSKPVETGVPIPLNANAMRSRAIFERKIGITPKDFNKIGKNTKIDDIIIEKVRGELEGKCSQHGWVIPGTIRILSRSMCQNEAGRFTGAMVSWVQAEGDVYYPTDNMLIGGEVLKKNKMGMFVTYENAVQVIIPRDLHIGDEEYDAVEIGQYVEVIIKKSRFQVNDPYIISVGEFKRIIERPAEAAVAVATATPAMAAASKPLQPVVDPGAGESKIPEGTESEDEEESGSAAAAAAAAATPSEDEEAAEDELDVEDAVPAAGQQSMAAIRASAPVTTGPARGSSVGDFL
jgi:DNA-directed RNA polymerase subunit E'/Rpb7